MELARNRYRAALAANPNHFWALNNLGSSFLEEGDPAQALPYLMKAQAIDPGNEKVIRNLAAARQALADNAGAKPEKTSLVFRNSKE
ncbi:MAG: tetratricopeptide repeat protein [Candidatus Omnitrophica bacterium]|nr:tetratricopeptide repeat protein [Candidatus Omnitrophota bacterium]